MFFRTCFSADFSPHGLLQGSAEKCTEDSFWFVIHVECIPTTLDRMSRVEAKLSFRPAMFKSSTCANRKGCLCR